MRITRNARRLAVGTAAVLGLMFFAGRSLAHIDGMTGYTQSATGCSCHGSSPNRNGAVTVTLTGPQAVQPGSTHTYTLTVSGGPAGTTGGFDLKATAGTLVPGQGQLLAGNEITHSDNAWRSWTFDWVAPATNTTAAFYAIAQATDGTGSGGDSWNFYGNFVNTPFNIQVNSLVGVDPSLAPALELLPAAPNPARGTTWIAWALPADGPATLAVYDAAGRRVATLAAGAQSAGRHVSAWDGRSAGGAPATPGRYFARLAWAGAVRTVSLVRLR